MVTTKVDWSTAALSWTPAGYNLTVFLSGEQLDERQRHEVLAGLQRHATKVVRATEVYVNAAFLTFVTPSRPAGKPREVRELVDEALRSALEFVGREIDQDRRFEENWIGELKGS